MIYILLILLVIKIEILRIFLHLHWRGVFTIFLVSATITGALSGAHWSLEKREDKLFEEYLTWKMKQLSRPAPIYFSEFNYAWLNGSSLETDLQEKLELILKENAQIDKYFEVIPGGRMFGGEIQNATYRQYDHGGWEEYDWVTLSAHILFLDEVTMRELLDVVIEGFLPSNDTEFILVSRDENLVSLPEQSNFSSAAALVEIVTWPPADPESWGTLHILPVQFSGKIWLSQQTNEDIQRWGNLLPCGVDFIHTQWRQSSNVGLIGSTAFLEDLQTTISNDQVFYAQQYTGIAFREERITPASLPNVRKALQELESILEIQKPGVKVSDQAKEILDTFEQQLREWKLRLFPLLGPFAFFAILIGIMLALALPSRLSKSIQVAKNRGTSPLALFSATGFAIFVPASLGALSGLGVGYVIQSERQPSQLQTESLDWALGFLKFVFHDVSSIFVLSSVGPFFAALLWLLWKSIDEPVQDETNSVPLSTYNRLISLCSLGLVLTGLVIWYLAKQDIEKSAWAEILVVALFLAFGFVTLGLASFTATVVLYLLTIAGQYLWDSFPRPATLVGLLNTRRETFSMITAAILAIALSTIGLSMTTSVMLADWDETARYYNTGADVKFTGKDSHNQSFIDFIERKNYVEKTSRILQGTFEVFHANWNRSQTWTILGIDPTTYFETVHFRESFLKDQSKGSVTRKLSYANTILIWSKDHSDVAVETNNSISISILSNSSTSPKTYETETFERVGEFDLWPDLIRETLYQEKPNPFTVWAVCSLTLLNHLNQIVIMDLAPSLLVRTQNLQGAEKLTYEALGNFQVQAIRASNSDYEFHIFSRVLQEAATGLAVIEGVLLALAYGVLSGAICFNRRRDRVLLGLEGYSRRFQLLGALIKGISVILAGSIGALAIMWVTNDWYLLTMTEGQVFPPVDPVSPVFLGGLLLFSSLGFLVALLFVEARAMRQDSPTQLWRE